MTKIRIYTAGVAVATLLLASGAYATSMSKTEYNAAKIRVGTERTADNLACAKFSGNVEDICQEKANGRENVTRAELEYQYSGTASDANKLAIAKADATYAVAKEMCDDASGNTKDLCVTQAKANHTKALADVEVTEKVDAAKQDATDKKRDADYKVAAERCDSLAGDTKSSCMSAAKVRFGKS